MKRLSKSGKFQPENSINNYLLTPSRRVHYRRKQRVGIYSGTFDPIHTGHVAFALQALSEANLDEVIFLPERLPRYKSNPEHFGHRLAMIRRALAPHPALSVAEIVDRNFSVSRTMPKLISALPGSELIFLFGSDVISTMPNWPDIHKLLQSSELVIGTRNTDQANHVQLIINQWEVLPNKFTILNSYASNVSSTSVREALRSKSSKPGVLESVKRYADSNWLYIALP